MCGGGGDSPEQTPEERELGRIAVERWNDYQIRFKPLEDKFIQEVQRTPSDFAEARGNAATAVQQSFGQAEGSLKDKLFTTGVDPSSSQFVGAMDGLSTDRALSMGTGINEAELAVDNAHLQGLQNVVQMGQGQAMESINGLGNVAGNATQDAINRANRSFQNRQAGLSLVGNVAGAGTSAYLNRSAPVTDTNSQFYMEPDYIQNSMKG